jgi:murein DD-endopeptidase MepM/ murein hydrolase activator NlpD
MFSSPASALRLAVARAYAAPAGRTRSVVVATLVVLLGACAPGLKPMVRPTPGATTAPSAAATPRGTPAAGLADADYLRERQLMVPVAGVGPERLRDSDYLAPRDGGARVHRALDIMAPRGTPVLSADDGRVFKVGTSSLGGLTVYVIDLTERFIYYYAHLDRYRDGIREGMSVARGELIGYVGSTGNASPTAPHLHFQAMRFRRDRYWDGEPLNPKPFLVVPGTAPHVVIANEQSSGARDEPRPEPHE